MMAFIAFMFHLKLYWCGLAMYSFSILEKIGELLVDYVVKKVSHYVASWNDFIAFMIMMVVALSSVSYAFSNGPYSAFLIFFPLQEQARQDTYILIKFFPIYFRLRIMTFKRSVWFCVIQCLSFNFITIVSGWMRGRCWWWYSFWFYPLINSFVYSVSVIICTHLC